METFAVEYWSDDGIHSIKEGFGTFTEAATWVRDHAAGWRAIVVATAAERASGRRRKAA